MKNLTCAALLVASFLSVGGCGRNDALPPGAKPIAPASAAPNVSAASPAPDKSMSSPAPSDAAAGVHGTVAEKMDVSSYTYLRLTTPKGDVWAAVPTDPVAVGTEVSVVNPMPMQKFESKALKKTFDIIYFGTGVQTGNGAPAASGSSAPGGMSNPHAAKGGMSNPHGGGKPSADLENIKVAKATGPDAHTVAEVFDQAKTLKDKNVTVRAKVVKATMGVMGTNWLHLRDGSGTDAGKNNDLVVTTNDEAKVNDEITVSGVVHVDKDLGAGYFFPVLIEQAKISK